MYHALHRVRYYRMLRVVWLGVECRRVTQLVGFAFRVPEMRGESRAVRRLATVEVGETFICLKGLMCERYSRESHGGSKLSHSQQEMSGDEDAELGPQDWRGLREFAGLGHR